MLKSKKGPKFRRENSLKPSPYKIELYKRRQASGSTKIRKSEKDDRLRRRRRPPGFPLISRFCFDLIRFSGDLFSLSFLDPNRTTRFTSRASRKLTMHLSSTTSSIAPSMSSMSEVPSYSLFCLKTDSVISSLLQS